ncbi:hypothetical protein ADH76_16770 [Enterocloster clostridioformis]|nr:hypothetical protein A4V08_35850 [Lachnoclostridium sp. YL32]MCA5580672.1 helix-turn-helix transcriptional regulator [Enterocloster clostridioformis]NDO30285.1 helix-turn-helix transcriptional regulator [Enterocloster clostridioformis]OXE67642.1 hypothetical protein ADH76_16770 [Enterocloster clostridioformis]QQQ99393.1 helix-turn-helix transcriptional regulator [Enterocloster clostridioformis]
MTVRNMYRIYSPKKPGPGDNIATVCQLLNCQPGDIIEYMPEQ